MSSTAIDLSTPLHAVPGIPAAAADGLSSLGVTNVGKLVAYLPFRHELHEAETTIDKLVPGAVVSARGEISATRMVRRGRMPRFEAVLMDETGRLDLVWFNMPYLQSRIHPGQRLRVQGKAQRRGPGIQIANPRVEYINDDDFEPPAATRRLRPVYSATESLPTRLIERAVSVVLDRAVALIDDHLPPEFKSRRALLSLADAYRAMHAPADDREASDARRRLAYDELFLLQLGVHMKRAHLRNTLRAPALRHTPAIDDHIRRRFPFTLTESQNSVIDDLVKDLSSPTPTNRLIQGDVGAGKTVVALYAMLMAVASDQQAALMAPTEILAEQHYTSITRVLAGSKVRVELLTGSTPKLQREQIVAGTEDGSVNIVVGTHALLTETVRFRELAVAVIDEQHRFGVHQRAALRAKAERSDLTPHVIVMTATPIPRTLAITLFGDLDISAIRGLPPGRKPVRTAVHSADRRDELYTSLRPRLQAGEQAYVVVPAIDPADGDETDQSQADVKSVLTRLETGPWAGLRLAALHGRLNRTTRDTIMERFRAGAIHALVATTVIEVGVDVPNATIMVVEDADRFGLAQLHQLRGRVGRGEKPSICELVTANPTAEGRARLAVLETVSDGFALAEKDFELRGPGELFGARQSGLPPFKVADLMRDRELLAMAKRDASEWIARSPALASPDEALLRRRLLRAYGASLGLGDVG